MKRCCEIRGVLVKISFVGATQLFTTIGIALARDDPPPSPVRPWTPPALPRYEGELRQYEPTEAERRYLPAIDPRKTYNLADLIDIAQQQCNPVLFGQAKNSLPDQIIDLRLCELLFRIFNPAANLSGPKRGVFIRIVQGLRRSTPAQKFRAGIHGDARDPSREPGAPLKIADILERLQKYILGRVTGVIDIAQKSRESSENATGVAPYQFREHFRVSILDLRHEIPIGVNNTAIGSGTEIGI